MCSRRWPLRGRHRSGHRVAIWWRRRPLRRGWGRRRIPRPGTVSAVVVATCSVAIGITNSVSYPLFVATANGWRWCWPRCRSWRGWSQWCICCCWRGRAIPTVKFARIVVAEGLAFTIPQPLGLAATAWQVNGSTIVATVFRRCKTVSCVPAAFRILAFSVAPAISNHRWLAILRAPLLRLRRSRGRWWWRRSVRWRWRRGVLRWRRRRSWIGNIGSLIPVIALNLEVRPQAIHTSHRPIASPFLHGKHVHGLVRRATDMSKVAHVSSQKLPQLVSGCADSACMDPHGQEEVVICHATLRVPDERLQLLLSGNMQRKIFQRIPLPQGTTHHEQRGMAFLQRYAKQSAKGEPNDGSRVNPFVVETIHIAPQLHRDAYFPRSGGFFRCDALGISLYRTCRT